MAPVGFAKVLWITVRIYSKVEEATRPKKNSFKISIIIVLSFYYTNFQQGESECK
jgi:hypothetical protein